jgi:hypothetical protein
MKERPILFSAPMVRAILAGSKTQTRRAMKLKGWHTIEERDDGKPWPWMYDSDHDSDYWLPCPYGQVGDRLWVREAWKAHTTFDHLPPRELPKSHLWYLADDGYKAESRTRASMHMPRWASRITLEITEVRVERLQDISQADAIAEGAPPSHPSIDKVSHEFGYPDFSRSWYAQLWEQINGAGSWEANPWVWAVNFRKVAAC